MNNRQDNITMPIDQYGRYGLVAQAILRLMNERKQKKVTILDVGGYKGEIHRFFNDSNAEITIIDLYDSSKSNYIKGSALDMPFKDGSFDYVVSFEVFEHIPRGDREKYITECLRVSKSEFILTAPFSGDDGAVLETEKLVNKFWKGMYGTNHKWLSEHIDYGTPSEDELETILKDQKLDFVKCGNNDLTLWNLMVSFNYLTTLFRPSGLNPKIQEFYNGNQAIFDEDAQEYYRKIYVISKNKVPNFDMFGLKKGDTVHKEATTRELTNRVFTQIARDIKKKNDDHKQELRTVSGKLEERIRLHDELADEYDKLKVKYDKLLSVKLKRRIDAIGKKV